MRPLVLITLLLLACCSNRPQREAVLNGMIGMPEADLVRQWGVPSRTLETGGRRFLAYREERTSLVGGGPAFGAGYWGWPGGWRWSGAWPASVVEWVCETTFEVVDGRIATWSLRGNACD